MKIATILGARPQFIKAALISEKINSLDLLSEVIIHTGQHYSSNMSSIFFQEMNIPNPKYNLGINQIEYPQMVDKMVNKIFPILLKEKVDGVLVYGDTNSTLAGSLSASKLNLPIFHVEAGLRSGDRFMHEENNRIITDHLSSLLFCPTKNAMKNLANENLKNMSAVNRKYYVYVIDLKKEILNINKFKDKNPDYIKGKPCVYVGQSIYEPKARFKQHLDGYKANRYAKKFGNFLRKKNTGVKNPYLSRKAVEKAEAETAERLRKRGYGVWSN